VSEALSAEVAAAVVTAVTAAPLEALLRPSARRLLPFTVRTLPLCRGAAVAAVTLAPSADALCCCPNTVSLEYTAATELLSAAAVVPVAVPVPAALVLSRCAVCCCCCTIHGRGSAGKLLNCCSVCSWCLPETSGDANKKAEPALHEAPAVAVTVAAAVTVFVLLPAAARGLADFLLPLPVALLLLVLLLLVAVGVLGGGCAAVD
jgi:hypothetical protein